MNLTDYNKRVLSVKQDYRNRKISFKRASDMLEGLLNNFLLELNVKSSTKKGMHNNEKQKLFDKLEEN